MPTVIQSDKIATKHLGSALDFGLTVPAYMAGLTFAAAYSLRQLRQEYTGPVLKVRQATTNAEGTVAFASFGVTTASLVTITVAGTSGYSIGQVVSLATFAGAADVHVVTWYDQSGNGRDAAPSTAAQQPRLMVAGAFALQAGRPIITFDGIDDRLFATFALAAAHTTMCVGVSAPSGTSTMWDGLRTGGGDAAALFLANSAGRKLYNGTLMGDTSAIDVSRHRCYGGVYNGASSKVFVDGVETASGNAGSNTGQDFRIAMTWNNACTAIKMQEVFVFPDATPDVAAISQRMMAYYGLL